MFGRKNEIKENENKIRLALGLKSGEDLALFRKVLVWVCM